VARGRAPRSEEVGSEGLTSEEVRGEEVRSEEGKITKVMILKKSMKGIMIDQTVPRQGLPSETASETSPSLHHNSRQHMPLALVLAPI
jgi:hypothetical protein